MRKSLLITFFVIIVNQTFASTFIGIWRWRNNDGNEISATYKGPINSSITIANKDIIRLRLHIDVSYDSNLDSKLYYSDTKPNTFLNLVNDAGKDPTAAFIFSGSNQNIYYGEPTTKQMPAIDSTVKFYPGHIFTKFNDDILNIISNSIETELEWSIKPTDKIQPGTTYYFNSNGVTAAAPQSSGVVYAILNTSGDINHPGDKVVAYHISASGNIANLDFTTALTGHDHYELQYRKSDTSHWITFKSIPGDNVQYHTVTLTKPAAQVDDATYSMRIALFDLNKIMSVSPSIKMTIPASTTSAILLNVYPNPGASAVSFKLNNYKGKTFTATLTSLYGKQAGKQAFTINGNETYILKSTATSGTYILNIDGENLTKTSRVLVQ